VNPRFAFAVGVTFVVVGIVYYTAQELAGFHLDTAGVTMILALSVAMSMMFYVLLAGSPREP
jgi:hypothetical protein